MKFCACISNFLILVAAPTLSPLATLPENREAPGSLRLTELGLALHASSCWLDQGINAHAQSWSEYETYLGTDDIKALGAWLTARHKDCLDMILGIESYENKITAFQEERESISREFAQRVAPHKLALNNRLKGAIDTYCQVIELLRNPLLWENHIGIEVVLSSLDDRKDIPRVRKLSWVENALEHIQRYAERCGASGRNIQIQVSLLKCIRWFSNAVECICYRSDNEVGKFKLQNARHEFVKALFRLTKALDSSHIDAKRWLKVEMCGAASFRKPYDTSLIWIFVNRDKINEVVGRDLCIASHILETYFDIYLHCKKSVCYALNYSDTPILYSKLRGEYSSCDTPTQALLKESLKGFVDIMKGLARKVDAAGEYSKDISTAVLRGVYTKCSTGECIIDRYTRYMDASFPIECSTKCLRLDTSVYPPRVVQRHTRTRVAPPR